MERIHESGPDPIIGWDDLIEGWSQDPAQVKRAFLHLTGFLSERSGVVLRLKSRPGVSYSLRASLKDQGDEARPLFALVDVVDDDPGQRWLSVCFYEDRVSDPLEMGNIVPKGLLGEDGYCFDVTEYREEMMAYLEERILEAYANTINPRPWS